jgi:hypothetical protein
LLFQTLDLTIDIFNISEGDTTSGSFLLGDFRLDSGIQGDNLFLLAGA